MNLQSFRMKTKPEFMIIPMIDIIFFLLVLFAAITSSIALTESAVSTFQDELHWSRKKSTIISTNLKLEDFSATYSERTFSRIASNYQMTKLVGKDIRIQKIFLGGK